GNIIRYVTLANSGAVKHMADQDVKVKVRGDAQTAAAFQESAKQGFVIQDQVACFRVGEEANQRLGITDLRTEDRNDEIDVLSGKLHPTVWPYYVHAIPLNGFVGINGIHLMVS